MRAPQRPKSEIRERMALPARRVSSRVGPATSRLYFRGQLRLPWRIDLVSQLLRRFRPPSTIARQPYPRPRSRLPARSARPPPPAPNRRKPPSRPQTRAPPRRHGGASRPTPRRPNPQRPRQVQDLSRSTTRISSPSVRSVPSRRPVRHPIFREEDNVIRR